MSNDPELESFRNCINLTQFAASFGYLIDPKKSSNTSILMSHPDGDKVIISRSPADAHWCFFSPRDSRDNGDIIQFLQNRRNLNIGFCRMELRPWVEGTAVMPSDASLYAEEVQTPKYQPAAVKEALAAMSPVSDGVHEYLNRTRKLPPALLKKPQLAGRILTDAHQNAVFPHSGADGVCGAEIKNDNFVGQLPGSEKGLWYSLPDPADDRLVICESAIDALSYAAIHGITKTRLLSTAGSLNPQQPELLCRAISKLTAGQVVIATDNDEGGDLLAEVIRTAFGAANNPQVCLQEDRPQGRGQDWNDQYRSSHAIGFIFEP